MYASSPGNLLTVIRALDRKLGRVMLFGQRAQRGAGHEQLSGFTSRLAKRLPIITASCLPRSFNGPSGSGSDGTVAN